MDGIIPAPVRPRASRNRASGVSKSESKQRGGDAAATRPPAKPTKLKVLFPFLVLEQALRVRSAVDPARQIVVRGARLRERPERRRRSAANRDTPVTYAIVRWDPAGKRPWARVGTARRNCRDGEPCPRRRRHHRDGLGGGDSWSRRLVPTHFFVSALAGAPGSGSGRGRCGGSNSPAPSSPAKLRGGQGACNAGLSADAVFAGAAAAGAGRSSPGSGRLVWASCCCQPSSWQPRWAAAAMEPPPAAPSG